MNHLMEIVHPGEEHQLHFREGNVIYKEGSLVPLSKTCQKCKQQVSRDYFKCSTYGKGCEYYIHKECVELKDLPQGHSPLHPQHPLAVHIDFPYAKSFVCSFCGKMQQSRVLLQCSEEQCDFYLDRTCAREFAKRPELLGKYEIQHFLHDHENHRLSPCLVFKFFDGVCEGMDPSSENTRCAGCGFELDLLCCNDMYKCTGCDFYLHTECSQVPKEVQHHYSHPQHPLVLLQNPPAPAPSDDHQSKQQQQLRCIACLKWMEDEFYLHCTHCPTFNLDLRCYLRFPTKTTVKHEAHEHPLVYFSQIYDDDVRCYACNTSFKGHLFRCFTCNFNIHCDCLALPITVNCDDHVHPLTLTTSFKDDEDPTTYYCDICEKRRDTDHGIYLCEECPFMAHFECALSLGTAEEAAHAHAPWRRKLSDEEDQEDMTLTNEKACVEILDQLNEEIEKIRQVIEELFINKELDQGDKLTETLQEFEVRHANTEDMLRLLKQRVREVNSNEIYMPRQ